MGKIINFFKAIHRANKAEVKEIISLKPTDEDRAQGAHVASIAVTALAACGVPCGAATLPILEKVFAYCIRDIKDGVNDNDKLLLQRIIKEIQEIDN